ncbi:hypothetical protein LZ30DRAFT_697854 [Colletotrichum cereale]|nr:hypothetical protein LZ30DRAFT_697854 [Colletotrichum cereale]
MALVYHPRTGITIASVYLSFNALYLLFECAIAVVRRRCGSRCLPNLMAITHYLTLGTVVYHPIWHHPRPFSLYRYM